MADLTAVLECMTAVLESNTAVITAFQQQQQATAIAAATAATANAAAAVAPPPVPPQTVKLDPFASANPFDLGSRVGSHAFEKACSPLDDKWDGVIEHCPSFLLALRLRASEVHWNAPNPQGILTFQVMGHSRNLLTESSYITEAIVETARAARIDNRTIQISRALYACLKTSITGDLKATLFDQAGNLPIHEDEPSLFVKLTSFTMAASLQLSMFAFRQILEFDPAICQFNISSVNTKLTHLFVLATTNQRHQLGKVERIQHVLTAYGRIKQPEQWASWVRVQVDHFKEGLITTCQSFMHSAAIKYVKIASPDAGLGGSSTTLQEDIVAMVATSTKRKAPAPALVRTTAARTPSTTTTSSSSRATTTTTSLPDDAPPFARHYKSGHGADASTYKIGDSRVWEGQTWYFCDGPHRDRIKWHVHSTETYRSCKAWLEHKGGKPPLLAHVSDVDDHTNPTNLIADSYMDATAALAHAFSQEVTDPTIQAFIADALNAIQDN